MVAAETGGGTEPRSVPIYLLPGQSDKPGIKLQLYSIAGSTTSYFRNNK